MARPPDRSATGTALRRSSGLSRWRAGIAAQRRQHPTNAPVHLPRPKRSKRPLLIGGGTAAVGALTLFLLVPTGSPSTSNTAGVGYSELPESARSPLSVPTVSPAPVAAATPTPTAPTPPRATAPPTRAPAPVAAAPAAQQAAPAGSVAQRNAVDKADSYLDYTAFSRTGLIKQLEFEGFSKADSTYAVDHIAVDWTEQADKKARSYMDYTSFSRSGLIKQLQFEGFTAEQAAHGATSVGL
jgi:hypothetical protein